MLLQHTHFTVTDIAAILGLQFVVESLAKYLPSKRQELTSSEALLVIMLDALQQPCLYLQPAVFPATKPECFIWCFELYSPCHMSPMTTPGVTT